MYARWVWSIVVLLAAGVVSFAQSVPGVVAAVAGGTSVNPAGRKLGEVR